MINKILSTVLIILLAVPVWAEEELNYRAPTQLPRVTREMQTPGYWIGRVGNPDKLLLDHTAVAEFNASVQNQLGLTKDITRMAGEYDGHFLRQQLTEGFTGLQDKNWYGAPEGFYAAMQAALAIDAVADKLEVGYGVVTGYADQRLLPTETGLYAVPGDIDFDELQNSALDIGTPVLILHASADGQWLYVLTDLSDGWVRADKVGRCSREAFQEFADARAHPVVITAAKADVYLDEKLSLPHDHLRMGAVLPAALTESDRSRRVLLPVRNTDGRLAIRPGFLAADKSSTGYLPFTPRVIIEQAFRMLNAPYGWGGMYGEQDCSRFMLEIFQTVGLRLPRNSGPQARSGRLLARFDLDTPLDEKRGVLRGVMPGPAVLTMRGHIMLYLGAVDGRPYAIHSFWAYREPTPEGDRVRVVNRVAVSDLDLGEGSAKGSLLKRLTGIVDFSAAGALGEE
ncbi:MAG: SH3 domain-containing protein [Candidatus Omnitrophica bacterium]|nr:SH3 domain-containing protein [Candidatus Omnitrophota bacterium]MCB9721431.1 SH3 domain-containing protein [Candidatus Omnitrophota bacterium]